jgi:hypothetical protein
MFVLKIGKELRLPWTQIFCRKNFLIVRQRRNRVYVSFVGDGDSSVHRKSLESVPHSRSIKKIECANHVSKNLTKHLFNLAKESNAKKSLLTNANIWQIGKTVRKVISVKTIILQRSCFWRPVVISFCMWLSRVFVLLFSTVCK